MNLLKVGTVVQIRSKPWYGCIGYITNICNDCYIIDSKRLGGVAASFNDVMECTEEYMNSDMVLPVTDPQELQINILLTTKRLSLDILVQEVTYLEEQLDLVKAGALFNKIEWNRFTDAIR